MEACTCTVLYLLHTSGGSCRRQDQLPQRRRQRAAMEYMRSSCSSSSSCDTRSTTLILVELRISLHTTYRKPWKRARREVTMSLVACRSGIIHYLVCCQTGVTIVHGAFRPGSVAIVLSPPSKGRQKIDILDIVSDVFLWFSEDHRSR